MKVAVLYVLVVLTVAMTLSQPTHDLNQVSECGCDCEKDLMSLRHQVVQELQSLRHQIALLNEKINDRNNGQTAPSTSTPSAVSPTPANG